MKKFVSFVFIMAFVFNISNAGEGMWIPSLLKKFNIKDMHKKGFKLSAEEIYSINNSSLKDAVVLFGRGCTGEIISDEGLLITNHHCGYGAIQSHSTVENNYLKEGFWAQNKDQELANPGLEATFLVRIEDVSKKVLKNVTPDMTEAERSQTIQKAIEKVEKKATEGTNYNAVTKPFYYGNEFYMFIYETYKDVRLVGAPPSSIGKFGGDSDNWMWPRHTGDFSLFRIYADENNEPAEYSESNQPYNPKKHLTISLEGYEEGDFTMVMGYPASTEQYMTSHGVNLIKNVRHPKRISIRDKRLEVMNEYMAESESIKIKYAAKQSGASNAWKKWKGVIRGLERYNAIKKKKQLENRFRKWAKAQKKRKEKYDGLLPAFKQTYAEAKPLYIARDFFVETGYYGIELVRFARGFGSLLRANANDTIADMTAKVQSHAKDFFKDYVENIDREICPKMLKAYHENVDERFHFAVFDKIDKEFDGNYHKYVNNLYDNTIFTDSNKVYNLLANFDLKDTSVIQKDPAYKLAKQYFDTYTKHIRPVYNQKNTKLDSLYRIYVTGLQKMKEDKVFWPDANFTMRVAYGEVKGYNPRDAVVYRHYTTLEGVMEKNRKGIKDYKVPEKLKALYQQKDFGDYAREDGTMPVCFVATNHTSGGNSGSPVMNDEGQLIGVNFDRNWEGTMSDIMYDPSQCRNISLDIRYPLFIIDKFANADHLIEEMTIVKE